MKKLLVGIGLFCVAFVNAMNQRPQGLKNCGASCYMNSTIQAFYTVESLTNILLGIDASISYKTNPLARSYTTLTQQLSPSNNQEVKKQEVEKTLNSLSEKASQALSKGGQEDAPQFIDVLINGLISSSNQNLNQSIKNLFNIQQQRFWRQKSTKGEYFRYEGETSNLFYISLPVQVNSGKQPGTLAECLDAYTKWEMHEERDESSLRFLNAPDYFIITLNRYGVSTTQQTVTKLDRAINIPEKLDIGPYLSPSHQTANYTLISAIYHSGRLSAGHYVAWVKRTAGWYLCNDEAIHNVGNFAAVKNYKQYPLDQSYVFIYQKETVLVPPVSSATQKPTQQPSSGPTGPTIPIQPAVPYRPTQPLLPVADALNGITQSITTLQKAIVGHA